MNTPPIVRHSARSDNQALASIIGCQPYEVPKLAKVGLFTYLNPDSPSAVKYGSTVSAFRLVADPKWLLAATSALKGGCAAELLSSARNTTASKRSRGLPRNDSAPKPVVGSAQWMIDAMLASMARDKTTGELLAAMIDDGHVARILGFRKHDLPPLRRVGILKCLNPHNPRQHKLHGRDEILQLVTDEAWLAEATIAINQHWKGKNLRKSKGGVLA